ncbi:hypothetical protein D0Z07_4229 [Hyphodiscus hymeniophilus]|uniref:DUF7053 domain-containing protein n=1 Tax=Hyphodiscus hymeniophilus TaxID=353542 RepID=A0A9P6VJT7_9HELO|nr:hypothetical protein D0Z07_4229 [Hyphodiscus hymeniophilus]
MSKRTVFTTLTPLPPSISRQTVMDTLHSHTEMIDLNPLVEERHVIKPPPVATAEEYHCVWYSLTDRVSYLPGGLMNGSVTYSACFHDLHNGLQTHCYAPMGLNIKGKWTLGGSLPGEPVAPVELGLGAPISGLYLREDVDMKCNIMMTSFVKKTLKKAHAHLVDRLLVKAQIEDAAENNRRINDKSPMTQSQFNGSQISTQYSSGRGSEYGDSESMVEEARDQRYSSAPQIPPMQQSPSLSVRSPEKPEYREPTTYEESPYPRALSVRHSAASYNESLQGGSVHGSQGRSSYQDPPNQRVSWQNLKTGNTPPQARPSPTPQNAEMAGPLKQQPMPYTAHSYHAELDSSQTLPKTTYQAPPSYGAAELE